LKVHQSAQLQHMDLGRLIFGLKASQLTLRRVKWYSRDVRTKKTMTTRFLLGALFLFSLFPFQRAWSENSPSPADPEAPQVEESAENVLFLEARRALDTGEWREARKKMKSYIRKNGKSAEAWTLLGRSYVAAGAYKKAKRRYDKALKFDPHFAPAYVGRGEFFEKKGRLDEAANDYQAAVLSDPNSLEARQALARLIPE
jgi:Tfp pilus assembly protein PilF